MTAYTIIKRDAQGKDELSYHGVLFECCDEHVCIDAVFGFADRDLGYMRLRRGDLFREWFFRDRWFNIFRVQRRPRRSTQRVVLQYHASAAVRHRLDSGRGPLPRCLCLSRWQNAIARRRGVQFTMSDASGAGRGAGGDPNDTRNGSLAYASV